MFPGLDRRLTTGGIGLAQFHPARANSFKFAGFRIENGIGRSQPFKGHTLFLGIRHFALTARHVRAVTAIHTRYALGALTDRRSHAIHRSVAATDHNHALSVCVQSPVIIGRHVIAKILAVGSGQVFQRREYAFGPAARTFQILCCVDTCRDEDRVVLISQR